MFDLIWKFKKQESKKFYFKYDGSTNEVTLAVFTIAVLQKQFYNCNI